MKITLNKVICTVLILIVAKVAYTNMENSGLIHSNKATVIQEVNYNTFVKTHKKQLASDDINNEQYKLVSINIK